MELTTQTRGGVSKPSRSGQSGTEKPAETETHVDVDLANSDPKVLARRLIRHCAAYRGADTRRSIIQLTVTVVSFVALIVLMFLSLEFSLLLTLLLAVPTAGFVLKLFIIQHDCGHGSYFNTRRANDTVGRMLSIMTLTPYGFWRRAHAQHHASSGDLERRGVGDIDTLTVSEYLGMSRLGRLRYRIYRNPIILIFIGAPLYFLVFQRFPSGVGQWLSRDAWLSVLSLNFAMVLFYGGMFAALDPAPVLMVFVPVTLMGAWAGVWLFFVQHQFEDTHWEHDDEWDLHVAALAGSSYYVLPRILQWFTGNIGLHHIHHLNSRIPNYRLQECLDASPELKAMNRLTFRESLKSVRLALWDEEGRKLVGFGAVKSMSAPA